jgi:acetyl-CoA carboxylase biotin carboxyl carrier protein
MTEETTTPEPMTTDEPTAEVAEPTSDDGTQAAGHPDTPDAPDAHDTPDAPAPADAASSAEQARSPEAVRLLSLIDRLEGLLERSELTEIEVEAAGTGLVLRTPAAISGQQLVVAGQGGAPAGASPGESQEDGGANNRAGISAALSPEPSPYREVLAPLTGLFYGSPSPDADPYIRVGGSVQVGQVIGLIEAMKLFNEIKSDVAGKVVRICVESGALVKAKQALIEVEPQ